MNIEFNSERWLSLKDFPNEIWKDIYFESRGILYDYRGLYQVSNYGRVKSLERITYYKHKLNEIILRGRIDKNGYIIYTFSKFLEKRLDIKAHRLVAFMFIPNPNPNFLNIVNHKDENKQNNFVDNLNWTTIKENNNFGTKRQKLSKPVKQFDINGNFIRDWASAYEVQKTLGYDSSGIAKCCKHKKPHYKGYIWEYSINEISRKVKEV